MARAVLLCLAFFVLLGGVYGGGYLDPSGTWEDNIIGAGPLYICRIGYTEYYSGVYSEIGFMKGVYNAKYRVWFGKWWQAGLTDNEGRPTFGGFRVQFTPAGSRFYGSYYYANNPSEEIGFVFFLSFFSFHKNKN